MSIPQITIITPTTGKIGLNRLFESIEKQNVPYVHILLWDDKRDERVLYPSPTTLQHIDPYSFNMSTKLGYRYSIVIPGKFINGQATGSALRAVGLMAANTPYVTFADDDIWYENNHFNSLLNAINGKIWAFCKRKIWTINDDNLEYLGIDEFESVGNDPLRKVPYLMVDNNSMLFERRFGASAACLYRETKEYNDDRLMYSFLTEYAGEAGKTNMATVNQICPKKLEKMFRDLCTRE